MSTSKITPAQILERFYAAERVYMSAPADSRDSSSFMACLSPTIKLSQSPDLPWGGESEGHEAFMRWGEAMAKRFDVLDVRDPKVFENGDDAVLVYSTLHLRARETGKVWEKPLVQLVRVDVDREVITEMKPFYWDVQGLRKFLGE
nr:hypothetical protein CFP56_71681 [Quercus suber]